MGPDIIQPKKHDHSKSEHRRFWHNKATWIGVIVFLIAAAGVATYIFIATRTIFKIATETSNPTTYGPTLSFLHAQPPPSFDNIKVEYNDSGIKVTNNEPNDWTNCRSVAVNDYNLDNPPTFRAVSSTYLHYNNFTRIDVRLNTQTIKPSQFQIWCEVNGTDHVSDFILN